MENKEILYVDIETHDVSDTLSFPSNFVWSGSNCGISYTIPQQNPIQKLIEGKSLHDAFSTGVTYLKYDGKDFVSSKQVDVPKDIAEFFNSKNCYTYTELNDEDKVTFNLRFC